MNDDILRSQAASTQKESAIAAQARATAAKARDREDWALKEMYSTRLREMQNDGWHILSQDKDFFSTRLGRVSKNKRLGSSCITIGFLTLCVFGVGIIPLTIGGILYLFGGNEQYVLTLENCR